MSKIINIKGFSNYEFLDDVLYRKSYKTKSISCKWQYRQMRKIEVVDNNGIKGYLLIKDGENKRKFYSLERLYHRLK